MRTNLEVIVVFVLVVGLVSFEDQQPVGYHGNASDLHFHGRFHDFLGSGNPYDSHDHGHCHGGSICRLPSGHS